MTNQTVNFNPNLLGFKVHDFLDLYDWKVLDINKSVPIISHLQCPADGGPLKCVSSFIGNEGAQKIRLGCCPSCGYVGYMDRPSDVWIGNFYSNIWDEANAKTKDISGIAEDFREKLAKKDFGRKQEVSTLSKKFPIDKNRFICEIGCGYGTTLKQLELRGFKKAVGMEHSGHRSRVAKKAYNLRVFNHPFESKIMQEELQKLAPFSLIYSHHVLEHTYNPPQIIKLASSLQGAGDYLILSVPNVVGEVSMATLAFLPHLHAFSVLSLAKLLYNNNYIIIDNSLTTDFSINIVAQKVDPGFLQGFLGKYGHTSKEDSDASRAIVEKLVKSLGLGESFKGSYRRLWWYRRFDIGGQTGFSQNPFIEMFRTGAVSFMNKLKYRKAIISRIGRYRYLKNFISKMPAQSLLISDLPRRFTSYQESPIEIQFKGNIKLFYR